MKGCYYQMQFLPNSVYESRPMLQNTNLTSFTFLGLATAFCSGCGSTPVHSSDPEAQRVGGSHQDQAQLPGPGKNPRTKLVRFVDKQW